MVHYDQLKWQLKYRIQKVRKVALLHAQVPVASLRRKTKENHFLSKVERTGRKVPNLGDGKCVEKCHDAMPGIRQTQSENYVDSCLWRLFVGLFSVKILG